MNVLCHLDGDLNITLLVLFLVARSIPNIKREGINWQRDERFMVFVTKGELLASNGHKSMCIVVQLFCSYITID